MIFGMVIGLSHAAWGADSFKFCAFGPETRVIGAKTLNGKCSDSVKVQGVMWKCCAEKDVESDVADFLQTIRKSAKRACVEYCESRGSGCTAEFNEPTRCGFSINSSQASSMGTRFQCSDRCEGKSVSYCSIYHAGFMTIEESMVKNKQPNCFCR